MISEQAIIADIRDTDMSCTEIARKYGVKLWEVSGIKKRHHLSRPVDRRRESILNDLETSDLTMKQVGEKYGITLQRVQNLKRQYLKQGKRDKARQHLHQAILNELESTDDTHKVIAGRLGVPVGKVAYVSNKHLADRERGQGQRTCLTCGQEKLLRHFEPDSEVCTHCGRPESTADGLTRKLEQAEQARRLKPADPVTIQRRLERARALCGQ